MIVKSTRELKALYHELSAGDAFIGNLSLKHLKQTMLAPFPDPQQLKSCPGLCPEGLDASPYGCNPPTQGFD
jgi:hypothetical protein